MNFSQSPRQSEWRQRVVDFIEQQVLPREALYHERSNGAGVASDAGLARLYAKTRNIRLADGPDDVHNRAIARLECKRERRRIDSRVFA